jgi:hypothetical protein
MQIEISATLKVKNTRNDVCFFLNVNKGVDVALTTEYRKEKTFQRDIPNGIKTNKR